MRVMIDLYTCLLNQQLSEVKIAIDDNSLLVCVMIDFKQLTGTFHCHTINQMHLTATIHYSDLS